MHGNLATQHADACVESKLEKARRSEGNASTCTGRPTQIQLQQREMLGLGRSWSYEV